MDFLSLSSKLVKHWIMFLTTGMKQNRRDNNTYCPGCVGITENTDHLAVQVASTGGLQAPSPSRTLSCSRPLNTAPSTHSPCPCSRVACGSHFLV